MQGVTILYALYARNSKEIDAARTEQLNLQRPCAEALHPAYLWNTLSVEAREKWLEEEAVRYDRFNKLVSMTVLAIPYEALRTPGALNNINCTVHCDANEAALMSYVWTGLEDAYSHGFQLVGWKIREDIWPRLVNRSLAQSVRMPSWAKPDLSKKWFDVELHDLAALYSCGVWGRTRPLPPIHYALKFWLNRDFTREDDVKLQAEINPSSDFIKDATCEYVFGLAEVLQRYIT